MILAFFETLARLAPLGTFLIALTAIIIAYNQLKTVRANEAKKQYLSYLDDCIKNPEFASGIFTKDNKLFYLWFLNKAFMANESILLEYKNDKFWHKSTYDHLYPHIKNVTVDKILTMKDLNLEHYSLEFQTLVLTIGKDAVKTIILNEEDSNNDNDD